MNWNKYPFLRLVMALVSGIALSEMGMGAALGKQGLYCVLLALLVGLFMLHRILKSYRYRWVHGVAFFSVVAFVGYCRASFREPVLSPQECNHMMQNSWCLARLYEPPLEREKTVKVVLEIVGFENDAGMICTKGKVMAYFQKAESVQSLAYGELIAFRVHVEPVAPPLNPGEFDYCRFLKRRGIGGMVYLKEGDWISTGVREKNALYAFAYRFRDRMLETLKQCGITGDEFGVGAAILLGYDDTLPAQVRHNYVAAGSMHILCVSGMHVGIIYLLASFLLGLLGKGRAAMIVRRVALLVLIWFYALVTGLSPSIMRSALMISLILVGDLIRRKGFTLNSIAASAFVLLLVDPNNLFVIGFQLSYVAVIGIVLLQKPISNSLYVGSKLLGKAWEITAVSLAAQIATMPFTVFYFNQFTPYFWLSNLLMTPLSFAVILSGMSLLMLSWVPVLNVVLGKIVWFGLHGMNAVAAGIERLPMSLVKGLYMDDLQFGLSLALLVLLWLFVVFQKKRMMMEMLALSLVFALCLAIRSQRTSQQSMVMLYAVRNHTALLVAQGFYSVLVCDDDLLAETSSIDYSLKGHWAEAQLPNNPLCFTLDEDFNNALAMKRKNLMSAQGLLLAFWDPAGVVSESDKIAVDYLLVRGKQKPDLCSVLRAYRVGTLLIDGSVPGYLAEQWKNQAMERGVVCVDVGCGALNLKTDKM